MFNPGSSDKNKTMLANLPLPGNNIHYFVTEFEETNDLCTSVLWAKIEVKQNCFCLVIVNALINKS